MGRGCVEMVMEVVVVGDEEVVEEAAAPGVEKGREVETASGALSIMSQGEGAKP